MTRSAGYLETVQKQYNLMRISESVQELLAGLGICRKEEDQWIKKREKIYEI